MRIVRIEMDGFKSFGRPTVFEFPSAITGVVGPNGCGKSNVVDATRWVLGEMSRKALRAKSSTDVIFSGSATRKPARYAEVSITFDNASGVLPFGGKRVKITRRLESNGDSEYRINDETAKLRDIRGLFEGTGAAMSAYSIMEQGKMDALLQSNPEDRRRVFEEAAGIGQLHKQKEQAQAKLQLVEQNLARLQDVLSEVKGRLRKIKAQAGRALKYSELKEHSRLMQQDLALVEFGRIDRKREELLEVIAAAGRREGAIQAELTRTRMDLEDAEARLADAEHEERRLNERIHRLALDANNEQARREAALARAENLRQAIARAHEQAARVREQIASLNQRREQIAAQAELGRVELAELARRVTLAAQDEAATQAQVDEAEARLKEVRGQLLDAIGHANEGMNERMRLEAELRAARRRTEQAGQRAREVAGALDEVATRRDAASAERDAQDARLHELKAQLTSVEAEAGPAASRAHDLRQHKHTLELKRGARLERKAMLESLAEARPGMDDHLRGLLADETRCRAFGVLGMLADGVRVDLGVAAALERVLKELGDAVVVDTVEHAHELFDWLAGRGSANLSILAADAFTPGNPPAYPGGKGVIGPLLDQVRVGGQGEVQEPHAGFQNLLRCLIGDVLLVADRAVARRLLKKGVQGLRLVTPTGELFTLPGAFTLAAGEVGAGIITQQSEIERLTAELAGLDNVLEQAAADLAHGVCRQEELARRAAELRGQVYDASMEAAGSRAALDALERECRRLAQEGEVLAAECAQWNEQIEADAARVKDCIARVAEAEEARRAHEAELAGRNEGAGARRDALVQARNVLTELKVEQAAKQAAHEQARDSLQGMDQALARYSQEVTRCAAEAEQHNKDARALEQQAEASVGVQAALESEQKELEKRRNDGGGPLAQRRAAVEAARRRSNELQERLYAERESVQQARIDENTLFMKLDAVRRRMAELFNVDMDTLYRDYDPAARPIDEAATKQELDVLEDQLKKLGNVNLEAVDELKEAEERNAFYARQESDLLKAKRTLGDVITRIEKEARRLFSETFESVRTNFQRLFRRLFGGGSADIVLTNPEDPLASGVEIIAKPPGKEALPLSMRSGGERALISVAMMFAIYETNPAPYAILDEVDAPLDEANVDRFNAVVADYAKVSQFIIITHHKKTMAACDTLYGVTMQEPGTSTKVSVDLRGVAEPELAEVA
jgi:chromosome segregation protein